MMIITTTAMLIVQSIIVTWVIVTNPEPCPKEYVGNTEYCEITSAGMGYQWSLKE